MVIAWASPRWRAARQQRDAALVLAAGDFAELAMSAPAMKVRPPPMMTAALTLASAADGGDGFADAFGPRRG